MQRPLFAIRIDTSESESIVDVDLGLRSQSFAVDHLWEKYGVEICLSFVVCNECVGRDFKSFQINMNRG